MSCLRSLPKEAEVVFHLDPSDPLKTQALRRIDDPRLRIFETQDRLGFAEGLNFAVAQARHELIARLDADDIALPWRWRYQIQQIEGLDVHFGSMIHRLHFGKFPFFLPHYPVALSSKEFSALALHQNPGFHPAAMFKRSAFLEVGGYRDALAEDYDLWLRMLHAGKKIQRGLLPVTVYRHHKSQATADPDWELRVGQDPLINESMFAWRAKIGKKTELETLANLRTSQPLAALEFRRAFHDSMRKISQ